MSGIEIYWGRLAELRDDFCKCIDEKTRFCTEPGSPEYRIQSLMYNVGVSHDTPDEYFERENFQILVEDVTNGSRLLSVRFEILRRDRLFRVSMTDVDSGYCAIQAGYFIYTGRRMLRLAPRFFDKPILEVDDVPLFEDLLDSAMDKLRLKPDPPFDFDPVMEYVFLQRNTYYTMLDLWNEKTRPCWERIAEKWDNDLNDRLRNRTLTGFDENSIKKN